MKRKRKQESENMHANIKTVKQIMALKDIATQNPEPAPTNLKLQLYQQ